METITLSVIVNCRHETVLTKLTLASLQATLSGLDAEIFLLGKKDGELSLPEPDQHMIPTQIVAGNSFDFLFSSGRKEVCKGEYILYTTSGVVWGEETMRNWLFYLEEYPRTGSIGGKMLDGKGNFIPSSRLDFPGLWDRIRGKNVHIKSTPDTGQIMEIDLLPPVNVLFRKVALETNIPTGISPEKIWNQLFFTFKKNDYTVCYLPQRFLVYKQLKGFVSELKRVRIKKRRLLIIAREGHFEKIKRVCVKRMPELEYVNLWDLGEHRVMDAICRRNRMKGFTDILFCYPDVRFEQMSLFAESLPATSTYFHIYNQKDQLLISPENSYGTT